DGNKSITATFAPLSSQFSVTVNTTGNGTVTKNPNQANYASGTSVTLTATPASGQQFTNWSGDANGSTNPLTITVNGNKNITAKFAAVSGALITNIAATTANPYILGALTVGTTVYTDRAYQTTDVPAFLNNAPFIKTPNDDKGNKASSLLSFTLTQSATVYVIYDPRATAVPAWLSSWQKLASQVSINDPKINGLTIYSKSFAAGKVTLGGNLASPAAGALNNYFVAALAQTSQFDLSVTTSGNGTVAKSPDQAGYTAGTGVTLTATPASGQQFAGWSGDASGNTNPLTITMDADKSITATFAPASSQYTLTVTTSGNGTVVKNPNQATYAVGTSVSLTATPAAGQQFTGWSGAGSGTANPLMIIMNANKAVTATFAPTGSGPIIAVTPLSIYDNDVSGGGVGIKRTITVSNNGPGALSLSAISTSGANTNQFVLSGLPSFPATVSSGASVSFYIAFNPTSTGLKTAVVNINSNDQSTPAISIPVRALGTAGLGGNNEPSLQALLNLLEIDVNVGDDDIATTVINS
ncbi:MAG: choice-of-anchor D domain-containing protein, partial [Mucilaginibacter sp.]